MKKNKVIYLIIVLLIIWCAILTSILVSKQKNLNLQPVSEYYVSGISTDLTEVVDEHKSSIVSVSVNGSVSTGFVYKQDNDDVYILTSYHGVNNNPITVVFANGYSCDAILVGYDVYCDLAVLHTDSPYSIDTLKMADVESIKAGEFIISIGTPLSLDYSQSVEFGLISNPLRAIENSITIDDSKINYVLDVIQLSSNLKPGYSGSPLLDGNGDVVGMTTMSLNSQINFAITSNEIEFLANSIISDNYINRSNLGFVGTYISDMESYEKNNLNISVDTITGLYVRKVLDDSISQYAGLKVGDIVLNINGRVINDFNDYLNIVYSVDETYEFEIIRDSEILKIKASLND